MGDSCFHLLFQRNSFVSWHLICSRARPLNESLCTPRACYIWGEVLYHGASVHAFFPLKVLVEHIYMRRLRLARLPRSFFQQLGSRHDGSACLCLCHCSNWNVSKEGYRDFARLRNSRWRFTEFEPPRGKKQDFKTCHKRFRDFEVGQKFSKTHFFRGTILYPYKWASLPAHINTATILRWYKLPRLIPCTLLKFLLCLYRVEALAGPLAKISARATGILARWASPHSHGDINIKKFFWGNMRHEQTSLANYRLAHCIQTGP